VIAPNDLTWIFGSSRSGSTWLLKMLRDHPGVVPIDETAVGHHLGVWRPIALAYGTSDDVPPLTTYDRIKRSNPDYLFSDAHRERWEPLLRDFLLARLDVQWPATNGGGPRRMVIKEPGGSHVADWLLELLPEARLVFLLRDGRDVVDSWLDAYQSGAWGEEEGAYPVADHGRLAFIRWQSEVWRYRTETVLRAYERHDPRRRVLVRYEDLLADTERELARVHEVVDVGATAAEVAATAERHAYRRTPACDRGRGKPVRYARPGHWTATMSEDEQATMHEVMGPLLRELGYLDGAARVREGSGQAGRRT
jgi:hypothetical protein